MLVVLLGPPQAGKSTFAAHLQANNGFKRVHILPAALVPADKSAANELFFSSSSDFLDYATRHWRCDFVTTDLVRRAKLVEFLKRPFVVVVNVEAPVMVRWNRSRLS